MVVTLKELNGTSDAGIYALSNIKEKGAFQMKIGRSIHIKKRLNDYHICYNMGFYVLGFLPLKKRTPEKDKLGLTMKMEKMVGEILGKPRTYENRKTRDSEWYNISTTQLKNVFETIHREFKNEDYILTDPPILKIKNEFINIWNVEGKKDVSTTHVASATEEKVVIKKGKKTVTVKKIPNYGYKKK